MSLAEKSHPFNIRPVDTGRGGQIDLSTVFGVLPRIVFPAAA